MRCKGITKSGHQCKFQAKKNKNFCKKHLKQPSKIPLHNIFKSLNAPMQTYKIKKRKIKDLDDEQGLDLEHCASIIQTFLKHHYSRTNLISKCINECELFTLDDLKDIPMGRLYIIRNQNHVYGFDLYHLGTYINKCKKSNPINEIINPLSSIPFTDKQLSTINYWYNIIKSRELHKEKENQNQNQNQNKTSFKEMVRFKTINLFYELGNYSTHDWIYALTPRKLKNMYIMFTELYKQLKSPQRKQLFDSNYKEVLPFTPKKINSRKMKKNQTYFINLISSIGERFLDIHSKRSLEKPQKEHNALIFLSILTHFSKDARRLLPHLYQCNLLPRKLLDRRYMNRLYTGVNEYPSNNMNDILQRIIIMQQIGIDVNTIDEIINNIHNPHEIDEIIYQFQVNSLGTI